MIALTGSPLVCIYHDLKLVTHRFSDRFYNGNIVLRLLMRETNLAYSVLNDNIYGIHYAIDYLVSSGHHDIVFVRNAPSYNSLQKQTGFLQAMEAHDLPSTLKQVYTSEDSIEGGSKVVDQILEENKTVTAIVCADDFTAAACSKRLKKLGIRIPADIAITDYDNTAFGKICDPMLTTVDTKFEVLSEIAANTLFDVLAGRSAGSPIYVRPKLIVREST